MHYVLQRSHYESSSLCPYHSYASYKARCAQYISARMRCRRRKLRGVFGRCVSRARARIRSRNRMRACLIMCMFDIILVLLGALVVVCLLSVVVAAVS